MTNEEKVFAVRETLCAYGIIKAKDKVYQFEYMDKEGFQKKDTIIEPEEIKTAEGWRREGREVLTAVEPIAIIPIYIKTGNSRGSYVQTKAKYYTIDQTFQVK